MFMILQPIDGITTPTETQREWMLGYAFKVIRGDTQFKRGSYITQTELSQYGIDVDVQFETVTNDHEYLSVHDWTYDGSKIMELKSKWSV